MTWEDYTNVSETQPDPVVYTQEYKAKMMGVLDTAISCTIIVSSSANAMMGIARIRSRSTSKGKLRIRLIFI